MSKLKLSKVPTLAVERPAGFAGRPGFQLWAQDSWYRFGIVGCRYYTSSFEALLGGRAGAEAGITAVLQAELVHEPWNRNDSNAVSVHVKGRLIGYVSREIASDVGPRIGTLNRAGFAALCRARLWYKETPEPKQTRHRPDWWRAGDDADCWIYRDVPGETVMGIYCSGDLSLYDVVVYPSNKPPVGPHIMMKPGHQVNVYGTQGKEGLLLKLMGANEAAAVYATLTISHDGKRHRVCVAVDGHPVGQLSIPMSHHFVPYIQHLVREYGLPVVAARLHITSAGGAVSCCLDMAKSDESEPIYQNWIWDVTADTHYEPVSPIDVGQLR